MKIFYGIVAFLVLMITIYSISSVFDRPSRTANAVEVFMLESALAATSGLIAPINTWYRNKDTGFRYEENYESDMASYRKVYNDGLYNHPFALIFGDIFGSIFSIFSTIAFFFARRSLEEGGGFKIMFFTEIGEETLYYINIYRMTGEFDVGLIDIGVTLVIAILVGAFGEYARKNYRKNVA